MPHSPHLASRNIYIYMGRSTTRSEAIKRFHVHAQVEGRGVDSSISAFARTRLELELELDSVE